MITVVIPTLNARDDYLDLALGSVSRQTYLPSEVIIINNGLGDVCPKNFPVPIRSFKIVHRAGVAQARNFGACLSQSKYVAFLDDDDLWSPDYLELMIKQIKAEESDCLIARLDQMINGDIIAFKNAHGKIKKNIILLRNPGITGSSVVVRKDSFIRVGGYDPKLPPSEDKALILEFLNNGLKVSTVPESQAILRQHQIQDRLTESSSLVEGIFQFYRKYKSEMDLYQRSYNLMKINKHIWLSQKSMKAFFVAGLYRIVILPLTYFFSQDKGW